MRLAIASLLVATLAAGTAQAASKTGQFSVRANVVNDCQLTTSDLDFGTYSANAASTGTTPIVLKCTPGAAVTISLDGGSSGNPQNKAMKAGSNSLNYQLYRDAAHSDPINTAGMAWQLSAQENTGAAVTFTAYGQVPANQNVPQGNYVDTIQVTASY
jgi:spore coat protein U-like protein